MIRPIPAVYLCALLVSAAAGHAHPEAPPAPARPDQTVITNRPQQPPGQTLPLSPARTLRFTTETGTWMSLDISRDGRTIVFDLLGDLYAMPATGGVARQLSIGLAFDTQPVFSPEGSLIAFVSDGSGSENLWVSAPDGTAARQVSFGDDDTILVSPSWSTDGRSLYVSRYRPSFNNYELWRYDLDGSASLVVPIRERETDPRSTWRSTLGAVPSPDGKSLYFARRIGGLNFEEPDSWTIVRRDLSSGEELEILREQDERRSHARATFFRPMLSPDGRLLAYGTRLRNQTELRVRNLGTGIDRRVAFPIEHDQLQASMWQDIIPAYSFTPDGSALIISRGGGFERIKLEDGSTSRLPFKAGVALEVGPSTRVNIEEETGPVRARLIQAPAASPDGETLAFSALGRLYTANLVSGSAPVARNTKGLPAFQPSYSRDGRQITFITWTERDGGAVWTLSSDGSGAPARMTSIPAYYSYPVFVPGERSILTVRSPHAARLGTSFEYGKLRDAELVEIPLGGGTPRVLLRGKIGSRPHFRDDHSGKVMLLTGEGLAQIDIATGALEEVVEIKGPGWYFQEAPVAVDDIRISPDGRSLLAQVAGQLHLVSLPDKLPATIDLLAPELPHRRITEVGADFFEWSPDGREIHWSVGSTFHKRSLASIALNPPDAPSWHPSRPEETAAWPIIVEMPRAIARGALLLRGARILTMTHGEPVVEDGDILVRDGRIAGLGSRGSLTVPKQTQVVNVSGKTIIPGFIDAHDHIGGIRREVLGLEDWSLQARLAYGVTTSFDPSTLSIDMLAYQDLIDAGLVVGPRLRSTAPAIFSMNRFGSLEDVKAVLSRYRDHYRLRNIKQYRTGSRRVRQWIAQAAREMGMHPTVEGALSMKLDLMQILDGFAGHEHALPADLHEDVLTLLREMRTSYTATLGITNGGAPAQDWFVVREDPAGDTRLQRFWPGEMIDGKLTARPWRRLEEYRFPAIAADAARLQRSGGLVGIGSHGDLPGIGYHFELEAHALGGMTPIEILEAATIGSAETIGRSSDLGSIEPGKLADLVILDADPREDIRAARAIAFVMKEGRLYDGASLDEIWPERRPLTAYWREDGALPDQWLPTPHPDPGTQKEGAHAQ